MDSCASEARTLRNGCLTVERPSGVGWASQFPERHG